MDVLDDENVAPDMETLGVTVAETEAAMVELRCLWFVSGDQAGHGADQGPRALPADGEMHDIGCRVLRPVGRNQGVALVLDRHAAGDRRGTGGADLEDAGRGNGILQADRHVNAVDELHAVIDADAGRRGVVGPIGGKVPVRQDPLELGPAAAASHGHVGIAEDFPDLPVANLDRDLAADRAGEDRDVAALPFDRLDGRNHVMILVL